MNFAVAFHALDKDQLARWLSWVEELGGMGRHRLFIMPAKRERADFKTSIPFEVVPDYNGIQSDWSETNATVRDAAGANSMLRGFAREFAARKLGAWTFIEPDCIPLRAGWHDEWEADYQRGGRPFMGGVVEVPGVPKHSTGNMVLPQDVADWCISLMVPQIADIGGRKVELAFDIAAANDILARHHETKLIQHVFRGPEFETEADLSRLDARACLYHTDKKGGLIRLLRARRAALTIYEPPGEVVFSRENAMRGLLPSPGVTIAPDAFAVTTPPLVHTYYRPCDDPDALAEQKRILAIWERSWREAGFEPVILTEAHAREHQRFTEWTKALAEKPSINPPAYEAACWNRHIAMAQIGGGTLLDYDCLSFGFELISICEPIPDTFPLMLCGGVPCAVVGTKQQFEAALDAFVTCPPVEEQGQPHLSDMHAAQQLGFRSVDICREYGTTGWKEAKLVHFNHYSCAPRKRSECMEWAVALRSNNSTLDPKDVATLHCEKATQRPMDFIAAADERIEELEKTIVELRAQLALCTPTNGPTAVSSASPTAPAKRRRGRNMKAKPKRSAEQQAADKARMAKVRAAKVKA